MNLLPSHLKLIILDIDGTLHVDGQAIEGAAELIHALREKNYFIRFMTNTTTKNQNMLLEQLANVGIIATSDEILSAPEAARAFLRYEQKNSSQVIKVWPIVSKNILSDFDEFVQDKTHPDYIVIGDIGDAWNLELLNRIFNCVVNGAQLIALHKNKFWQTQNGLKADIGLFIAGLEYITNHTALIMGKPSVQFFQQVLASVNCKVSEAILIGDDIDSDVGGAQRLGIFAGLVKTGKYRASYHESSKIVPDLVLDSITYLTDYID